MIERRDPPIAGDEITTLRGWLDFHRDTLRLKTAGLDATQLDTALAPSSLTLGGLLAHLAFVEDYWLPHVMAGRDPAAPWAGIDWRADRDADFHLAAGREPGELHALLDDAVAASDRVLDELLADGDGLERLSARSRHGNHVSLRWTLTHLIEEYARHNGHADLIREALDGSTGE
ncbi:DinB family protein [Nocardioides pacificus]